jgi:plastocyanin
VLSAALLLVPQLPAFAQAQSGPQTLVIGVDHPDMANQRPDQARVFEYTDFFSRDVSVRSGDTIDFHFAPGSFHVIALAPNEQVARTVYPVALLDIEDNHVAPGTGFPKVQLGPSNGPILGGSVNGGGQIGGPNDLPSCGLTAMGEKPCAFAGGGDIEGSGGIAGVDPQTGNPVPVDWFMQINAGPGDYAYFCYIHPGMRGSLHVVDTNGTRSTQADIDAVSAQQFQDDQALGLQAEQKYNVDTPTTDSSGVVTHHVSVGVSAADNHVAIDEMLPRRVSVNQGDQVEFKWRDEHNVHTVGFAQAETQLPGPFVFDCGTTSVTPPMPGEPGGGFCFEPGQTFPEFIGDPGNALSGVILSNVQKIVDSGLLAGTDYGVQPTVQTWSVRTDSKTQSGTYQYWCSVHDFMNGALVIGG